MAGSLLPVPRFQFFDDSGAPLSGGKVYFYAAGTSTPQATYSDSALTTPNSNPVILDSAGRATIYLSATTYKVVVNTSADVLVWSQDNVASIAALVAASSLNGVCEGRLTLTSATPVTVSDVTAATTVYWTPYRGNRVALYDGVSAWNLRTFSELSIALGADAASLPYDVFAYDNSGTVAIERLVWTNGTTRATALVLQDGVLVKSGATTRRYLGTYRTTSVIGQTEDSGSKRFVWNYYHRVRRNLRRVETTASWTYTTAVIRQANGAAANQVEVVVGIQEAPLELGVSVQVDNSLGSITVAAYIGEDSTSAPMSGLVKYAPIVPVAPITAVAKADVRHYPAVGYHFYAWLEFSTATGTTTWYGSNIPSGLFGSIEG